jgi:predicted amidophosphoribosyltransferase
MRAFFVDRYGHIRIGAIKDKVENCCPVCGKKHSNQKYCCGACFREAKKRKL